MSFFTLFHNSIKQQQREILSCSEENLSSGGLAFVNGQDAFGDTPLLVAAKRGHQDCVLVLMNYGADAALTNRKGRTVFYYAPKLEMLRVIDVLFEVLGSDDVKVVMDELAGKRLDSHREALRQLLALECARQGCSKMLLELLNKKVDVDVRGENNDTLLHCAAKGSFPELYLLLRERGATEEVNNNNGLTPGACGPPGFGSSIQQVFLNRAILAGDVVTVYNFLKTAPDAVAVLSDIYDHLSPLHRAVLSGKKGMMRIVWKFGNRSHINSLDLDSNTPQLLAIEKRFIAAIRLLARNSDFLIRNKWGNNALDLVVAQEFPQRARELIQEVLAARQVSCEQINAELLSEGAFPVKNERKSGFSYTYIVWCIIGRR